MFLTRNFLRQLVDMTRWVQKTKEGSVAFLALLDRNVTASNEQYIYYAIAPRVLWKMCWSMSVTK